MFSGRIKGAWGHLPSPVPPLEALPPHLPPVRRKNGQNQLFLAIFLDFCPLRNAFCPLDAPTKKKIWCRHCQCSQINLKNERKTWSDNPTGQSFWYLPFYPHGQYTMVYTKVLNIGEGPSNQDKPTRYCEQGRRSVLDMGREIIWWRVSTNCALACAPSEAGKFCIFGNELCNLVNTFRHKFRADE